MNRSWTCTVQKKGLYDSFPWLVQSSPSTLSHFTDKATCKVTQKLSVKDTVNSKDQWQQSELVFSLNKWQCRVE